MYIGAEFGFILGHFKLSKCLLKFYTLPHPTTLPCLPPGVRYNNGDYSEGVHGRYRLYTDELGEWHDVMIVILFVKIGWYLYNIITIMYGM